MNNAGDKLQVKNCAILGYYAARCGNSLPAFRDNLYFPHSRGTNPIFLIAEDGTDRLSRNVGNELPLHAA